MTRDASSSTSPAPILVVDDEPDLRTLYELTLLREGYAVSTAGSLSEARALLGRQRFAVLITDMRLPDGLGLELLRELAQARRIERSIVITAYGSAENAVEALKQGAFDYLTKPVDLKQFRAVVRNAVQAAPGAALNVAAAIVAPAAPQPAPPDVQATARDAADLSSAGRALARLVGDSPVMRAVKTLIVKVAPSMAPVLVRGESGTGKELVARAIHDCSHRAGAPFVPVNCGAIPENLLEAEFFGVRKGAYTGAVQDREGFFQTARGGTLFLDEIGDLPLAMQAKLLRAIQERRIRPLGEPQEEAVDVRFVSATHKDLAAEVQAGRFRQDLYYRLNVIEIVVPPLRERRADLPLLARALLARITGQTGLPAPRLPSCLLARLQAEPLPGNVRELENILHRAVALGEISGLGDLSDTAHDRAESGFEPTHPAPLPDEPDARGAPINPARLPHDLQTWIDEQERRVLVRALEQTGFNRTAAAARLGLNLRQIRYRMARLGITAPGSGADERADAEDHDDGGA
ncbi:MAG: sigma-54 dependent transcriptional regulator [Burkholderiaceae bacterium]|jgi:two-component system response regulator PilR (NtrC family)|nr:sigma-54 dependent transcriptional regulator [Burkholderiaceae bacterium]